MQLVFVRQIKSKKEYDAFAKQWGVPPWKSRPVPNLVISQMFRDFYQPTIGLNMDEIILKYVKYSRESIRRGLTKILTHIVDVLLKNENRHVERFNKQSYADYLASLLWYEKRHVMLYPTGPFDQCWRCGDPISLSTGHLHHLTYDHVGYEPWEDLQPLCAPCHRKVHHLDWVPQDSLTSGGIVVPSMTVDGARFAVVPNARIVERSPKGALKVMLPNGKTTSVNQASLSSQSEIREPGQTGTFVCEITNLFPNVQAILMPWARERV